MPTTQEELARALAIAEANVEFLKDRIWDLQSENYRLRDADKIIGDAMASVRADLNNALDAIKAQTQAAEGEHALRRLFKLLEALPGGGLVGESIRSLVRSAEYKADPDEALKEWAFAEASRLERYEYNAYLTELKTQRLTHNAKVTGYAMAVACRALPADHNMAPLAAWCPVCGAHPGHPCEDLGTGLVKPAYGVDKTLWSDDDLKRLDPMRSASEYGEPFIMGTMPGLTDKHEHVDPALVYHDVRPVLARVLREYPSVPCYTRTGTRGEQDAVEARFALLIADCPKCGAQPGEDCANKKRLKLSVHKERIDKAGFVIGQQQHDARRPHVTKPEPLPTVELTADELAAIQAQLEAEIAGANRDDK